MGHDMGGMDHGSISMSSTATSTAATARSTAASAMTGMGGMDHGGHGGHDMGGCKIEVSLPINECYLHISKTCFYAWIDGFQE
jgi:hypothetical protein